MLTIIKNGEVESWKKNTPSTNMAEMAFDCLGNWRECALILIFSYGNKTRGKNSSYSICSMALVTGWGGDIGNGFFVRSPLCSLD